MLPAAALLRNISLSNIESSFLMLAVCVRLLFARLPAARNLLFRLGLFLLVCGVVTYIGNWLDQYQHTSLSIWFNL